MPVYAALNPKQTDVDLRAAYANLIRFAASDGQTPGTDLGQLPPGYAPLPQPWVDQALAAADAIERGSLPTTTPTQGGGGSSTASGTGNRSAPQPSAAQQPASSGTTLTDPAATGDAAGELIGTATPDDPELGVSPLAVPAGLAAGLGAALAVPLMGRIRRRA
jgi:hypothetical protein